jgi:hypothetical protein
MKVRSSWAAAAAVVVAALVAVGCGAQDEAVAVVASAAFLSHAADRTVETGTGHMSFALSIGDAKMTATGDYDSDARQADLSVDISGLLSQLTGNGELPSATADAVQRLFSRPIAMVVDGSTMYIRFPILAQTTGSDGWLKLDAGSLADGTESPFGGASSGFGAMGDPSAYIDFLRGASDDVTTVGHETVGGVDTTHLHATVMLSKALANAPESDQEQLQQAASSLGGSAVLDLAIPVDVFVDAQGRIRRTEMRLDMSSVISDATAALGSADVDIVAEYSNFGEAVHITVPSNAVDTSDMLSSGTGGG